MASELLKRQALINKLKEPNVEDVNFDLANSSLDYSIESITEDILPEPKPAELFQEREKVRSERLLGTLNTLGGGLMDESVDFIKRENFAEKAIVKKRPDLGEYGKADGRLTAGEERAGKLRIPLTQKQKEILKDVYKVKTFEAAKKKFQLKKLPKDYLYLNPQFIEF